MINILKVCKFTICVLLIVDQLVLVHVRFNDIFLSNVKQKLYKFESPFVVDQENKLLNFITRLKHGENFSPLQYVIHEKLNSIYLPLYGILKKI